jgi:GH24 family phage-related lysozyme (muramidase)
MRSISTFLCYLALASVAVLPTYAQDPVLAPASENLLPYDSAKSLTYLKKWCKDGNDCPDGQFREPNGTDCTHFIAHALLAGGVNVANLEPTCKSGCCIRVKQLAPAFANAAARFSNVSKVEQKDAKAGDFVFQVSLFGSKSHVMVLADKPDDKGAKIYGHETNRCGEYVEFDLSDCKFYRIEDAVAIDLQKLEVQLTKHEGKRNKVYKDSVGIPTIGIGFNLKRPDAKVKIEAVGADYAKVLAGTEELTDDQISKLFKGDISTSVAAGRNIVSNFDELSDVRKRVIVDMIFNLGEAGLKKFKNMRSAVEANNFGIAGDEMKSSKWYKQVKSRGVTLVAMMKTDKDPDWLK